MLFAVVALLGMAALAWTPDLPQAELDAKYLNQPSDRVTLVQQPTVQLHVRDQGPRAAPAVLMLHGFGASLHTWDAWADALAAQHRVIRIDLPGSGLSPPDPTGIYTDARTADLVLSLLDQLQLQEVTLLGHSIGGRIAWRFAAHHPERVSRLVLVAPDGFSSPGFDYGKAPEVPASLRLMTKVLPKPLLRMSLEPAFANPAVLSDALTQRYFDLMRAPGSRAALLARMEQTVLTDPRPMLRQIRAPTLLLWGEQDAMIPFSNHLDYLAALPNARLAALSGIGHLPQEEQPDRGLAALLAFLRE